MNKTGFATMKVMNPGRLKELAQQGGKIVHATGKAHRLTDEERRSGGRKRVEQGMPKRSAEERTLDLFPEPQQTLLFPDDDGKR